MYESDDKMVSHPEYYKSENGLEVIDVIEAFTAGLEGIEASDTANIIKYIYMSMEEEKRRSGFEKDHVVYTASNRAYRKEGE